MCGRFYLTASPAEIKKHFKIKEVPEVAPRYNIAPTQSSVIIVSDGDSRGLHTARWGLVPPWARDLSLGAGMINAGCETLHQKSAFNRPFRTQRCLIPANGFYEWQRQGAKKQPYKIALRNGALIAFAGLWERWTPEIGEPVETFAIITTKASKLISEVHDRMPVIIEPNDYRRWLTAPIETAENLLAPYRSGLTIAPASERVNSVKNDDVELIAPL
jgi:putative SOS response-associated peptidase YedK